LIHDISTFVIERADDQLLYRLEEIRQYEPDVT
jgi:hypothetical protein